MIKNSLITKHFMEKEIVTISKSTLVEAFNNGSGDVKKVLKDLFGKDVEPKETDWIELWNKFCKENNLSVNLPHDQPSGMDEESENAFRMLKEIIKFKNKGWVPDWNKSSQYKYYPWFYMTAGSGFSLVVVHASCTYANVGARLVFESEDVAEATAIEFLPIYKKFMMYEY